MTKQANSHHSKQYYDLEFVDTVVAEYHLDILRELGFEPNRNGTIQCSCPIHDGDNETAFTYCPYKKRWRCWTHHCHEECDYGSGKFSPGTGMIGLVRCMLKKNFPQAIEWILEITGKKGERVSQEDIERKRFINKKQPARVAEERIYDKKILRGLDHNVEYFLNRGFSYETLKDFEVFYSTNKDKPLYGRACIPLFNLTKDLIGFAGRKTDILPDDAKKWWYGGIRDLSKYLFGTKQCMDQVEANQAAIIVEGPLDCMMCYQNGLSFTLSTFSNNISMDQIKLLVKYKVRTLIVMFDPDSGGEEGLNRVLNKCRLFFNVYNISDELPNDPAGLSTEEYQNIVKPKVKEILNKELQRYE